MTRPLLRLFLVAAILSAPAIASAADPAAARAQLEAGYALKEQGKYADALPHLLESLRLDPQLKTLTNLADCEEHTGHLVDAQQHWVMARDRASLEQNPKAKASVEARLAAVQARMPKLTIKLAADAPKDAEVSRDGTVLGAISLGTSLPLDPGAHSVVVRAAGRADESVSVVLAEGEQKELEVKAGAPRAAAVAVTPVAAAPAGSAPASSWSGQKTGAVVAAGVAVVGVAFGAGFGLSTGAKWSDAQNECGKACPTGSQGQQDRSTALTDATISDISFVVAGVALAGAAALWFTAPSHAEHERPRPLDALRVVPALGKDTGGVAVLGSF